MEPIVKLVLPLNTWMLQKAFGPVFARDVWRAIALSFVPPPDSLVNTIKREGADLDTPALGSASVRRRFRRAMKGVMRRAIDGNSQLSVVRDYLLQWRKKVEAEGCTADPARIRKLRDIEAETNEYYTSGRARDDMIGMLTPGGNERRLGPIEQQRLHDAVTLAWEFALYGEGGSKPRIRRNSPVWKVFDINPEELEPMPPEKGALLFLSRFMSAFGLNGGELKIADLCQLLRWAVKTYLPPDREPETTPEAINKAMESGLVHKGIITRDDETGEVAVDIEDPNADQFVRQVEVESDSDRLSQFCELAGIEMNTLTDGESSRILDMLRAEDAGYDFASKQGMSMAAYYGDKADSENTQRQRLFKKIREASDKVK